VALTRKSFTAAGRKRAGSRKRGESEKKTVIGIKLHASGRIWGKRQKEAAPVPEEAGFRRGGISGRKKTLRNLEKELAASLSSWLRWSSDGEKKKNSEKGYGKVQRPRVLAP